MSDERIIYGFCGANCRVPVYSREEVLSILQQTIEAGDLQGIDVTKSPVVRYIRESRADANMAFWVGTEAEYNALSPAIAGAIAVARIDTSGNVYLCTDDTTFENFLNSVLEAVDEQTGEALGAFKTEVDTAIAGKANSETVNAAFTEVNTAISAKQAKHTTAAVTLAAASWSSGVQTVSAAGVTASNTVIVAPAPDSQDAYTAAGVKCTAQAEGTLTFTCVETLADDLTVNVVILGV